MSQPKDKDWLNGYKNKTPIYVVYKRPIKTRDTYRLKVKDWKKIFHANGDRKKAGVATFISGKIALENKVCEKRQRTLHNDQRINPRRRYNNYKYICIQHRSTTICKTNAIKYERGN